MQVEAFLNRPLEFSRSPYVYLDATYLHRRDPPRKQVISRALIVAVGITASGQREVLGIEVGDSEVEAFWAAFLRRLKERGPDWGAAGSTAGYIVPEISWSKCQKPARTWWQQLCVRCFAAARHPQPPQHAGAGEAPD